eukprot:366738-Prorocentrum_lima.AAC.1
MEKLLHPPSLGQIDLCPSPLGEHGLSYDIKLCPGKVEQISPSLQAHQQFTCISTLDPQSESSPIGN